MKLELTPYRAKASKYVERLAAAQSRNRAASNWPDVHFRVLETGSRFYVVAHSDDVRGFLQEVPQ